jgi:hypothetical protein
MIQTIARIGKWAWRAWPLIAVVFVGAAHFVLIEALGFDPHRTNQAIALATQLSGGLFVLYSIDSTIGIVSGTSLTKDMLRYLREFPLIKRNFILRAEPGRLSISGGRARLSVGRNPANTEEALAYLQEQINEIRRDVKEDFEDVRKLITEKTEKLAERLQSVEASLSDIKKTVTEVAVGGVKLQVLGVLLVIYGSITAYAA